MRAFWSILRVVIALAAVGLVAATVVFVTGPSGTSLDPNGVAIDAVAVIVLVAVTWSLWRDRRSLF